MAGQQRRYEAPGQHGRRERPPSISIPDDIDTTEMLNEIMMVESPSPQQQHQWELSDLSPLARLSPLGNVSQSGEVKGSQGFSLPDGLNPTDLKMLMALSPANVAQHSQPGQHQGITPQLLNDITPSGAQLELHPGWSLGFWDVAGSGDATQQAMATSANFLAQQEVPMSHPILAQAQTRGSGDYGASGNVKSMSPSANPKWGGMSPAAPNARGIFTFNPNDAADASGVGLSSLGVSGDLDFPMSPMFMASASEEAPLNQQSGEQQQLLAARRQQAADYAALQQQIQANQAAQAAAAVQAQQAQHAASYAMHQDGKPKPNHRKRNRSSTPQASFGLGLGLHIPGGTPEAPSQGGFSQAAGARRDYGLPSAPAMGVMPPLKQSVPPESFQKPRSRPSNSRSRHLTKSQEDRIVDRVLESATNTAVGGAAGADQPRTCNCKKSRCLKLYCECFAAGSFCLNKCRCNDCCNNPKYQALRAQAIRAALARNPEAFNDKFEGTSRSSSKIAQHRTGCRCKRSACLKKYCECFMADVVCGQNCKCTNCQNFLGSEQLQERRQQIRQQEMDTEAKRQRRAQQSGNSGGMGITSGYPHTASAGAAGGAHAHMHGMTAQRHHGHGSHADQGLAQLQQGHRGAAGGPHSKGPGHMAPSSEGGGGRGNFEYAGLGGSSGAAAAAAAAAATAASWNGSMGYASQAFNVNMGSMGGMVPLMNQRMLQPVSGAQRGTIYGNSAGSGEFASAGQARR